MTIADTLRRRPEFGLTHRLALAREVAELDQADIAIALGISRQTVSNYERGTTSPKKLVLNAWALACGVDVQWLSTGYTPRDLNPEPTDCGSGGTLHLLELAHAS